MHKIMKRGLAFLLSLIVFCSISTVRGEDTLRLKVMTYNLRFGERASLTELAGLIRSEHPDFVAIQEVDCRTRRDGIDHQHDKDFSTELGLQTGMFPLYGKTIAFAGGWYGVGILSAHPYIEVKKVMLPQTTAAEEPRALLVALFEVGGDTVAFASTHWALTSESRQQQAEAVSQEAEAYGYPMVLGGDFNAEPDAPEIQTMCARWRMLTDREPTFPSEHPTVKIDYLFGHPAGAWELESTRVVPSGLSDHCPVVSVIRNVPVR